MDTPTYLTKLERNLMVGTGHWVADFTESFREYAVDGVTFDMFIKGNTRAKGFLMSRVVSFLLTPNYYVGCFVYSGPFESNTLHTLTRSILNYSAAQEMTWTWLLLASSETPSTKLRKQVENWNQRELGIALIDLNQQQVAARSETQLGRALTQHVKLFK